MKRTLVALILILSASSGYAISPAVWKSSTTSTSTGAGSVNVLCAETRRGVLHGICTDFGVAAASTTVVNSTFSITTGNMVGPVSTLVADQCKYFDTFLGNGLGYYKPNVATVTYLYDCY